MEWIAHCTVCGELERAPNGPMMESVARLHRRDTGHTTIIGYEPPIVLSGKMVEVGVKVYYWEITNMVTGDILKHDTSYSSVDTALNEAKHFAVENLAHRRSDHMVIKVFDKSPKERAGLTLEPIRSESFWIEEYIEHEVPTRPFPQTIAEWADLGDEIKRKDPESIRAVNDRMGNIYYNIGDVDGAKRWLIEKSGELGIK